MQVKVIALLVILVPHVCFAQPAKKVPVAVSHDGDDDVGRSVARGVEDAIRSSRGYTLVDANAAMPRIIINMYSVDAFNVLQLRGRLSAIAISIVYHGRDTPGTGVFLNMAVNSCGPEIIEWCVITIIPYLDDAADLLQRHDPDLWKTL